MFDVRISPQSPQQRGTLVFAEAGGKTTLTMTIECETVAQRDAMLSMRIDAGTVRTLENLAAHLRRRPN